MRTLLAITMILLSQIVLGQQNLVINGSFEEPLECPGPGVPFAASATGWVSGTEAGTPDHFHTCVTVDPLSVPCNWRGCQEPRTGNGYAGIYGFSKQHPEIGREYLQTELSEPLQTGIRYEVRFYVNLAEFYGGYAISTIGAAFSTDTPDTIAGGWRLNIEPTVLHTGLPIADTINWILISDTIVSRGDYERFLTIGNFYADGESDTLLFNPNAQVWQLAYYFIDDVSVIALDSVPSGVGIDEMGREYGFKVYPNPSNGNMTLEYKLNQGEEGRLEVFDLSGRVIYSTILQPESSLTQISLKNLQSGLYLLHIRVDGSPKFSERISIIE